MRAATPPDQVARLAALHDLDVLDSPREAEFDDVVALASRICETPISVINLIDADRQWFKAETGLGVRETPLDTSICAHAILTHDFLEVPDTLRDARMADNPLCQSDPGLRFYAGALLTTESGHAVGTLCVLDTRPRKLTDLQRDALQVLARQVMKQLNLRVALRRMEVLRHEADHRVKNSLAQIASLIRLQLRRVTTDETRSALEVAKSRIATVGALHAALSGVGDGRGIRLDGYLSDVVGLLRQSLPAGVTLVHDLAPCTLPPSRAADVAVIMNEWLMNAAKHGFPGARAGTIRVSGERRGDSYALVVSDDGVGIGAGTRPGGIGLGVVSASAAQLGGTVTEAAQATGTGWILEFPVPAMAQGPSRQADAPVAVQS
jgi:two-component sensor histidine kinase